MEEALSRLIEGILLVVCSGMAVYITKLNKDITELKATRDELKAHYYTKQQCDEKIVRMAHNVYESISNVEEKLYDHLLKG